MGALSFFDNVGTYVLAYPQGYRFDRLPTWVDHETLAGIVWRDFSKLEIVYGVEIIWEEMLPAEFATLRSVWLSMALGNSMTFTDFDGVTYTVGLDQGTLRLPYSQYYGSINGSAFQSLYSANLYFRAISTAQYAPI